ncbi:MAG: hypothetical protein R3C56_27455 [Pirellulaceae bacterium]
MVDIVAPGKFSIDSAHDDLDSEYIVGRVWAERLDWFLAETLGFSPVHLCDAASSTWLQVYETLMSKRETASAKDLHLEDMVDDLVFVHEFLIHPEVPDRLPLLDAALRSISSNQSLVLMYHEPTEPPPVDDWELRDLGFKKIARSSLLLPRQSRRAIRLAMLIREGARSSSPPMPSTKSGYSTIGTASSLTIRRCKHGLTRPY